jgi:hypothetical protein
VVVVVVVDGVMHAVEAQADVATGVGGRGLQKRGGVSKGTQPPLLGEQLQLRLGRVVQGGLRPRGTVQPRPHRTPAALQHLPAASLRNAEAKQEHGF